MIHHSKYPNGNIYLSGGMEHAADLGATWRAKTAITLRTLGFYPLDITALDREYEKAHGDLWSDLNAQEMLQRKANIRKHFIYTDLQLIKNDSDALIVYYDESVRRGAGTISECQYAYLLDLPIFIVSAFQPWEKTIPGWLLALSTKVFQTFDELFKYLENLPPAILKRDIYGNRHSGDYYLCSLSGEPFKKSGVHFVSKVSPLYNKESVETVRKTNEQHKDRYEFIVEYLEAQAIQEIIRQKQDK
jgi:hypothetical protein